MERLELETELRHAVERGELALRYAPVRALHTGDLAAFDAQLYWHHPRRGLLESSEFLRVAEESGSIVELGRWALQRACEDAREWQNFGPHIAVQVELSPRQLEQPDFTATVEAALDAAGLDPSSLYLDISESAVAQADETTVAALQELRAIGVRVALNDVGAGVSSLSRLSVLAADVLKVRAGAAAPSGVLRASVGLASALGMTVTAQGVAQVDEAARLAAMGCTHAEGRLFGPPLSPRSVADLLLSERANLRVA